MMKQFLADNNYIANTNAYGKVMLVSLCAPVYALDLDINPHYTGLGHLDIGNAERPCLRT